MTPDDDLAQLVADVALAHALRDLDATLAVLAAYAAEHDETGAP